MKEYFYTDGTNKYGPYSLEELKGCKLTKQTKVWFEGLKDWTLAGDIDILNEIFITRPLIINNEDERQERCPKTWLFESIVASLLWCFLFGILSIIYASQVRPKFNAGDIEGAKKASKQAKKWFFIAISIPLIFIVIIFIISLLARASGL